MSAPPQKDWLDIAIDFFFGALFADIVVGFGLLRGSGRAGWLWRWDTVGLVLFAITAIAGSLAALYRNQFWSRYEGRPILPPMDETVSRPAKIVLWSLFALGCASLGLVIIW